jgi:geranylgeranyl diphosphate synthase type II
MTSTMVPDILREYGELIRAAVRNYLPAREPRRYLYDLVADYPERGGKMMRPSLCIATARAFGARLEEALLTAVSIELLHNALLIHDDIQDESEERRGRPTLHVLHGVPLALNAGDMLSLMSLKPLIQNRELIGDHLTLRIIEETERMAHECAEGQALELGWRRDNTSALEDEDYLEMVLKKTCWLATIYPIRVGALIGSRDSVNLDDFGPFAFLLGATFQIQDDLLNLVAEGSYGKELNGDIWEGKRTLMLIRLFREADVDERSQLSHLMSLARDQRRLCDIVWIRKLMDKYGCVEYARRIAHGLAGAAQQEFVGLSAGLPDSRDKRFLEKMVTWVIERT